MGAEVSNATNAQWSDQKGSSPFFPSRSTFKEDQPTEERTTPQVRVQSSPLLRMGGRTVECQSKWEEISSDE